MARQGLKVHQTRTPKRLTKTKPPKGKTLAQVRQGGKAKT
jgi:hypothetical protein